MTGIAEQAGWEEKGKLSEQAEQAEAAELRNPLSQNSDATIEDSNWYYRVNPNEPNEPRWMNNLINLLNKSIEYINNKMEN